MGGTAEDRFVGATFAAGIGSMRAGFAQSVDWEVDPVYYAAAAVPEPAAWAAMPGGLAALAALKTSLGNSRRRSAGSAP